MPKHTSSPQRMMLTTITELIDQAKVCRRICPHCNSVFKISNECPLMTTLLEAKHSLQTEVKNLGEDDREVKP